MTTPYIFPPELDDILEVSARELPPFPVSTRGVEASWHHASHPSPREVYFAELFFVLTESTIKTALQMRRFDSNTLRDVAECWVSWALGEPVKISAGALIRAAWSLGWPLEPIADSRAVYFGVPLDRTVA